MIRLPCNSLYAAAALFLALVSGCGQSIHDAALRGDVERARGMLDAQPDLVHARNALGKTPLHQSVTGGNDAIIELFLARRADVNARDKTGLSPLHVAAWWSITDRALILVRAGADLHAQDAFGDTPLHTAAMHGRGKMCKVLIEQGADISAQNKDGRTPLDLARLHEQAESIRVLEYFRHNPPSPPS